MQSCGFRTAIGAQCFGYETREGNGFCLLKGDVGALIMSTPFSDDETDEHRMYAPKVLRQQSPPPAPQLVRSAPMPASHVDETSRLGLRGGLEDTLQYPTSEPEAVSEP